MRINVALDICGTLGLIEELDERQSSFYLKKGAMLTANGTHYTFPGMIEFVRLLFQMPDRIKVSLVKTGLF